MGVAQVIEFVPESEIFPSCFYETTLLCYLSVLFSTYMCALVAVGKCIYRKIRITKCGFELSIHEKKNRYFVLTLQSRQKRTTISSSLFIDEVYIMLYAEWMDTNLLKLIK
jgi:hypothetical protein